MVQPLPQEIRSSYKGASEVVQYTHNDEASVFHVWTYHGEHHTWKQTNQTLYTYHWARGHFWIDVLVWGKA